MQAVALERSGEVFEAMQMYRKAVHLDSEIEFKMYDKMKTTVRKQSDGNAEPVRNIDATATEELIGEHLTDDLVLRFSASMHVDDSTEPSTDHNVISDNSLNLMSLPMDVLAYILRWVVSSNLDLRSLEQCSLVCKAFYLCSRQTQIWRLACQKYVDLSIKSISYINNLFVLLGIEFGVVQLVIYSRMVLHHGVKCILKDLGCG